MLVQEEILVIIWLNFMFEASNIYIYIYIYIYSFFKKNINVWLRKMKIVFKYWKWEKLVWL